MTNKATILYISREGLGTTNKLNELISELRNKGSDVSCYVLNMDANWAARIYSLVWFHLKIIVCFIFHPNRLYYVRYNYQFLFLYLAARFFCSNFQLEVNSDHQNEFKALRQGLRAHIDNFSFVSALKASKKIHVVSQELIERFRKIFPSGNYVYNPNFVVDKYFITKKPGRVQEKTNLIFLGNPNQDWQGIPLFIEKLIIGNEWAKKNINLHIVGHPSKTIAELTEFHNLMDTIFQHGFLKGDEKRIFVSSMDIGIGVFDLKAKGMTETTSIKVGEYLYAGLPVIIGYRDLSLKNNEAIALYIDLHSDTNLREKFRLFVSTVRQDPKIRCIAHNFAVENLLASNYVTKILK